MISIKILRLIDKFKIYKIGDSYQELISKIKKIILEIENKPKRTSIENEFILLDFSELKELKNKTLSEIKEALDYKKILENIEKPSKECKLDLYNSGVYKKGSSFYELYYNENLKNLENCSSYNFKILRDFNKEELQQILELNLIDKIFSNKHISKNTQYDKKLSILCLYLIKYFNLYHNKDNLDTFIKKIKEFKDKNLFFDNKKQELMKKAKLISCLEELDYSQMRNMSSEDLDKLLSFDKNINEKTKKILLNSISAVLAGAIFYKTKKKIQEKDKEKKKKSSNKNQKKNKKKKI